MSFAIWITGPSGAGKTTLANALHKELRGCGCKTEVLDGDKIRSRLYPELGFSEWERSMHNRNIIEMSRILTRNDIIAIVSLISPFRTIREQARAWIGSSRFIEVYINCPLEVRVQRDPKGLYSKAIKGEIKGLTGYDGIYEEPEDPDVNIDSSEMSVEEEVNRVMEVLDGCVHISIKL